MDRGRTNASSADFGAKAGRAGDRRHQDPRAASLLRVAELAVGDVAPDLTLLDPEEKPVTLSSLWNRAPLVLIFLRHFG